MATVTKRPIDKVQFRFLAEYKFQFLFSLTMAAVSFLRYQLEGV